MNEQTTPIVRDRALAVLLHEYADRIVRGDGPYDVCGGNSKTYVVEELRRVADRMTMAANFAQDHPQDC